MTRALAYKAIDASGQRLQGAAAAVSAAAVRALLEAQGLVLLCVTEAKIKAPHIAGSGRPSDARGLLEFTRALATLLPAGLPLARALCAAAEVASPQVAAVVREVQARVERGGSLATALAEHPGLFPPLYTGLVRAGERSGNLAAAFQRLAQQLERDQQLRSKLIAVSIYPLLLAVAGGVAVLVLLLLVIPRFVELLQGTGASLPRSTALVLALSTGLRTILR